MQCWVRDQASIGCVAYCARLKRPANAGFFFEDFSQCGNSAKGIWALFLALTPHGKEQWLHESLYLNDAFRLTSEVGTAESVYLRSALGQIRNPN